MASYVEGALTKDERVIYTGQISLWALTGYFIIGTLLLPAYGIGLLFFARAFIIFKSTELAITNKRVIAKFGFFSRRTIEINIQKIESLQVVQGLFGRMLDYGTLIIAGAGNPQAPITSISNPMNFRKAFIEAQELAAQPSVTQA